MAWHPQSSLNGSKTCGLGFIVVACLLEGGCGNTQQQTLLDAENFLVQWLANSNASQPATCHAFGLLMFPAASCADMQEHAAQVVPESRKRERIKALECFGDGGQRACGEFVEIWYASRDRRGRPIKEGAVVKRDDGKFRLYWYRSDLLFTTLTQRAEAAEQSMTAAEQAQDRLSAVYNEMVNNHSELYAYPPCLDDVRVSSTTMLGSAFNHSAADPGEINRRASSCASQMCFALIGQKVATLCP